MKSKRDGKGRFLKINMDKQAMKTAKTRKISNVSTVTVRMAPELLNSVDECLSRYLTGISREMWIREAIFEKIKKENANG